jgi:endonuclease YncB( thermonuclease family)
MRLYKRITCALISLLLVVPLSWEIAQARKWRSYEECELKDDPANDGDSFHVRYTPKKGRYYYYLVRLYFVDTPESDDSLPERVAEQAEYFGITPWEAVRLGKKATKFTREFLEDGFTFYTKHSDAMGRSKEKRRYSFVKVGDQFLSEALVANGLARVYGNRVDLPDGGPSAKVYGWRLEKLEREAKRKKLGGWAKDLDRMEELQQRAGILPSTSQHVPVQAPPDITRRAPARSEPEMPEIEEREIILPRTISVYSLKDERRKVGMLRAGATVTVLKAESPTMLRIRFRGNGKIYEAQCRRLDLGL